MSNEVKFDSKMIENLKEYFKDKELETNVNHLFYQYYLHQNSKLGDIKNLYVIGMGQIDCYSNLSDINSFSLTDVSFKKDKHFIILKNPKNKEYYGFMLPTINDQPDNSLFSINDCNIYVQKDKKETKPFATCVFTNIYDEDVQVKANYFTKSYPLSSLMTEKQLKLCDKMLSRVTEYGDFPQYSYFAEEISKENSETSFSR